MVTPEQIKKLGQEARSVQQKSYSPYSKAKVGAAVLTATGKIFIGCNVENGSYGATVCAERSAISASVSAGEREIIAIYVYTIDGWAPCGICRQVIKEFASDDLIVILGSAKGEEKQYTLNEIYPLSFGPRDMGL